MTSHFGPSMRNAISAGLSDRAFSASSATPGVQGSRSLPDSQTPQSGRTTPPVDIWRDCYALTFPERPNSDRSRQFLAVIEAIRRLAKMDPNHDWHVDEKTASTSEKLIATLNFNYSGAAPKIFPHEGDTLVLTWESPRIKRLLSISGDEFELIDIDKLSRVKCDHLLQIDTPEKFNDWLSKLGGAPSSRSDLEGNAP